MKLFTAPKRVLRIFAFIAITLMFVPLAGAQEVVTGDSPVLDRIMATFVL